MRDWTKEERYVFRESGIRCFVKSGVTRASAEGRMETLARAFMSGQTEQSLSAAKFAKGTLEPRLPSRFDVHGRPRVKPRAGSR